MPVVRLASSTPDLAHAADLFRRYARSLPQTAQESLAHQGFEHEIASLPGRYAPPGGCILLAEHENHTVGVVALRPIPQLPHDPGPACEMKRLFVLPAARGLGIGRLLCEALLAQARSQRYAIMKLDTEPGLAAACALYHSLGFTPIPRYNEDPVPCTLFLGLAL